MLILKEINFSNTVIKYAATRHGFCQIAFLPDSRHYNIRHLKVNMIYRLLLNKLFSAKEKKKDFFYERSVLLRYVTGVKNGLLTQPVGQRNYLGTLRDIRVGIFNPYLSEVPELTRMK